jgi:Uma2 family endonuclease
MHGLGGPGGWWILDEPELHFPNPEEPDGVEVLDPDIAGWRCERMPELPATAYFTLAPYWICEVLSPSTATFDREEKMPIYAREGVKHAWLVDPIARTLEVYELGPGGVWGEATLYRAGAIARIPPFEAIELDLSILWAR